MVSQLRYGVGLESVRDEILTICKVFFAELVALLHGEGKTASSFLRELYDRYGSI
jgi:hypothetical protein